MIYEDKKGHFNEVLSPRNKMGTVYSKLLPNILDVNINSDWMRN